MQTLDPLSVVSVVCFSYCDQRRGRIAVTRVPASPIPSPEHLWNAVIVSQTTRRPRADVKQLFLHACAGPSARARASFRTRLTCHRSQIMSLPGGRGSAIVLVPTQEATGGTSTPTPASSSPPRRTSTHSIYARAALMSNLKLNGIDSAQNRFLSNQSKPAAPVSAPPKSVQEIRDSAVRHGELKPPPSSSGLLQAPGNHVTAKHGVGNALSDTPAPSNPGSPRE